MAKRIKTIFNLNYGDFYYFYRVNLLSESNYEIIKTVIETKFDMAIYQSKLSYNDVYLTKKDCQDNINYNKALLKINKRAAELMETFGLDNSENVDDNTLTYITYNKDDNQFYCPGYDSSWYGKKLVYNEYIAETLIKEMPKELKLVLKYRFN